MAHRAGLTFSHNHGQVARIKLTKNDVWTHQLCGLILAYSPSFLLAMVHPIRLASSVPSLFIGYPELNFC